jgi:hypothetical protein
MIEIDPDTTLKTPRAHLSHSIHKAECLDAMIEGLGKAGLPE